MRRANCVKLLRKAATAVGTVIDSYYTAQGAIILARGEDGNAYTLEIKPAAISDFEPFVKYLQKKTKGRKVA